MKRKISEIILFILPIILISADLLYMEYIRQKSENALGNDYGYEIHIDDKAHVFARNETPELIEAMRPITEYCNVFLITIDREHSNKENNSISHYRKIAENNRSIIFVLNLDSGTIDILVGDKDTSAALNKTYLPDDYQYALYEGDYIEGMKIFFEDIYLVIDYYYRDLKTKCVNDALIAICISAFILFFVAVATRFKLLYTNTFSFSDRREYILADNAINFSNIKEDERSNHGEYSSVQNVINENKLKDISLF